MRLRDFFAPEAISLDLGTRTKAETLAAMVRLLCPSESEDETLRLLLERREALGSTGVGRGIAIPHCRASIIPQLRLAFGRVPEGVPYDAIDGQPVRDLFLIVAPPIEASNLYLPVLGRLAQFAKGTDIPERLSQLKGAEDFYKLLDERGA
jgi:mannitol/fructose-specific phosphotransferase system IIA component (Ntr-type)